MGNTKISKIRYAIMHNPTLIPVLVRDTSINKGMIYRELNKVLPCRVGIEFEMGANFLVGFREKYDMPNAQDDDITKFYKVLEIKTDPYSISQSEALSSNENSEHTNPLTNERIIGKTLIETRVSIIDFHQLAGLYKFMQDLPEFCTLHEGGGIHVHIDMSKYKYRLDDDIVANYITNRLDQIGEMFPTYTGTYNRKRVGHCAKQSWVNISRLNTLEFRILPLTFDYELLISWIFSIVKFRRELIHKCKLEYPPKTLVPEETTRLSWTETLYSYPEENTVWYTREGRLYGIITTDGTTSGSAYI